MPQPVLLTSADTRWGKRTVVKFGGLAIPVLGTTMTYMDLNSGGPWYAENIQMTSGKKLPISALSWRGRGVYMGIDFQELVAAINFRYDESTGSNLMADLTTMMMAGTQNLTFDNLTAMECRLLNAGPPKMVVTSSPFLWEGSLSFHAAEPWFKDIAASTLGSTAPGTIPIAYAGTVWAEPTYTVTITSANATAVQTLQLGNTTSGEQLFVTFSPSLTASTAWTITVNCATMKATDNNGLEYDMTGAYPLLYPGTNNITFALTPGGVTNATITGTWNNRWGPPA